MKCMCFQPAISVYQLNFWGKGKIQGKLSRFEELNSASISFLGVGTPGDPAEICASVPNLKELDLTGNLISDWKDVGTICEQLPHLVALNLSNNLMTQNLIGLPLLKGIHVLVLNGTGINWSQPTSSSAGQGFDSLRLLNLEDNCLTEWNEILKLSQLKSLEQLYLNKNKLNSIFYPDKNKILELLANQESCEESYFLFQNLCCLLLGSNEISDLASIDSLNSFPKLIDIRLSENPIADSGRGGLLRFALIARLAKVEMLNGSKGSPLPVLLDDEMDIGIGNDSTIIVDEESSLSYFGARKKYTNTDDGCNLFLKWLSKESSTVDHCKSTLN